MPGFSGPLASLGDNSSSGELSPSDFDALPSGLPSFKVNPSSRSGDAVSSSTIGGLNTGPFSLGGRDAGSGGGAGGLPLLLLAGLGLLAWLFLREAQ